MTERVRKSLSLLVRLLACAVVAPIAYYFSFCWYQIAGLFLIRGVQHYR